MNIFNMNQKQFDAWINSPEGLDFIDKLAAHLEQEMKEDEFFCAKECWRWECEYNSHYNDNSDIEMGHYTVCHKFKNGEENTCGERNTWFYEEDE